ncbi:hypothetical protein [Streptomyces sp. TBY4]|uniref:hypothetical protein n=1 Tax=Streptomyces sp. TBY4 TaxID=2962030 RepID=UPI0020B70C59|nr:hypothetical protein [Streptomyces sp. TBY4]MCP3758386.1 hypothetical protein [Streptomyces sp. TBY4]
MIPCIDMEVDPSFPTNAAFGMPAEEDVSEEGFGLFRGTWLIGDVSHDDAVAMIGEERQLATHVDLTAPTHAEFEAIAGAIESNDPACLPPGFTSKHAHSEIISIVGDGHSAEPVLGSLDIGVAGLSYALTSVGCITAASCRGHLTEHAWSDHPVVFFAAERTTVHWLTSSVRESGCGFADASSRGWLIAVEAPSITNFMDLANLIVSRAAAGQARK